MDRLEVQARRWPKSLASIVTKVRSLPLLPLVFLLPIVVFGIFGPWLCPHDPTHIDLTLRLQPPVFVSGGDWTYILGTDHLGRDILSRLIDGARISLTVALFGVGLSGLAGLSLGMMAGYWGGWIDNVIMRWVDIQMSIPAFLLAILVSAVLGGGIITIIVCISLVFWTNYARVIRGETLRIKQDDFVTYATVTGCRTPRILIKHIFPNVIGTFTVLATLQLGMAITMEAALTFLGLGLQPPASAWGLMIAEGRIYISTAWWIPTFAGLAIMITVLGANLLGDWLRDKLDPKLRQV